MELPVRRPGGRGDPLPSLDDVLDLEANPESFVRQSVLPSRQSKVDMKPVNHKTGDQLLLQVGPLDQIAQKLRDVSTTAPTVADLSTASGPSLLLVSASAI
jgi:hypothetical protein